MFHGTATGSPAVCCWLSEDGTRPLCISWVAGGVPVFPHVSIFWLRRFCWTLVFRSCNFIVSLGLVRLPRHRNRECLVVVFYYCSPHRVRAT